MWPLAGLLRGPGFLRRECGLVGPAFSTMEDSERYGGCPSPSPGRRLGQSRAGKEPGRENVSHTELGLWVQLDSGSSIGVWSREGV